MLNSKRIITGAAGKLLSFATAAFAIQNAWTRPTGESKRHPVGKSETGPEAATSYRIKRNISRAHASSLRKLDREARIYNGKAPLKHDVPGRREKKIIERAERREKIEEARAARAA